MSLPATEFVRRFLNHVLPAKFVRIRHFGFLGSRLKQQNIEIARKLLNVKSSVEVIKDENYKQLLLRLVGHDVTVCPCCNAGRMIEVATLLPFPDLFRARRDTS